jgi:signal transduction histidine kinase
LDVVFVLGVGLLPLEHGSWIISALYLWLLISTATQYGWREVAVVVATCLAFFLLASPHRFLLSAFFTGAAIPVLVLALHKRSILERLSNVSRQLVFFRSEANVARDMERRRIAADFHDGPLQSFISFQMRLEIVRRLLERDIDKGRQEVTELQDLVKHQITGLRSFIRGMRPPEVEGASLAASLGRVVEEFRKDSRIEASLTTDHSLPTPDSSLMLEVLQIVRESLNNVHKHSKASHVSLSAVGSGGRLEILVEDNGVGFPFSGTYTLAELEALRLGPVSIKRRLKNIEGGLTLESRPGYGARLTVSIPV